MPHRETLGDHMPSLTEPFTVSGLDRDAILERMEGDVDLLEEIVQLLLEDSPRLIDAMRVSLANADAAGLRMAAHAMKGSLSNFGSLPAGMLASELEVMGQEENLDNAAMVFASFLTSLERLQHALVGLVRKPVPSS
jgi:two-component system sensor histidine kinase/response regulator